MAHTRSNLRPRPYARAALGLALAAAVAGCAPARRFALRDPLWADNDTRPVPRRPAEYWSPLIWDAADQQVFRPVTRALLLETGREAVNVNTLDEVPDSSWYTNRLARRALSPEQVAQGACADAPPLPPDDGRWLVTAGKPNGWFPGFIARGPDGHNYVVKADGGHQGQQPTAAEVIGSRLYWAAGYFAPCNRVITLSREQIMIGLDARYEDERGERRPVDDALINRVFSRAMRMPDGRYRFGVSLFVEGRPIGPFTYQGIRDDDPNDAIPHEDRRDLRGARLMAAWLGHFDSREQNTLTTWVPDARGEGGHVRHWMIDFGDCFGGIWTNDGMSRRLNHSGYFDAQHSFEDFVTLGLIPRPWDRARMAPAAAWIFGYFRADDFDPAAWRGGYPNPAFNRMTERDGAWMARIISRLSDAHLRAAVAEAHFALPEWSEYLVRTLAARRDRVLARYLTRVSPLADVTTSAEAVCAQDRALATGVYRRARYRAFLRAGRGLERAGELTVHTHPGATVCAQLPPAPAANADAYRVVEFAAMPDGRRPSEPLAVHVYDLRAAGRGVRLVGLER